MCPFTQFLLPYTEYYSIHSLYIHLVCRSRYFVCLIYRVIQETSRSRSDATVKKRPFVGCARHDSRCLLFFFFLSMELVFVVDMIGVLWSSMKNSTKSQCVYPPLVLPRHPYPLPCRKTTLVYQPSRWLTLMTCSCLLRHYRSLLVPSRKDRRSWL